LWGPSLRWRCGRAADMSHLRILAFVMWGCCAEPEAPAEARILIDAAMFTDGRCVVCSCDPTGEADPPCWCEQEAPLPPHDWTPYVSWAMTDREVCLSCRCEIQGWFDFGDSCDPIYADQCGDCL